MDYDRFICEISLKEPIPRDSYLYWLAAIRRLEKKPLELSEKITFIMGENGSGKSTLVEGIAAAFGFNPEGGSLNYSFETRPTHSELWKYLRLSKLMRPRDGFFLRAESFYNAASYLEELDSIPAAAPKIIDSYGGLSLHEMSHGEGFLRLVQNRFSGLGLYILDEPEAALSPLRVMTLMCEIHRLCEEGSQFIIATHSPMLPALPNSRTFWADKKGLRPIDYRETEHFKVMKRFLGDPDGAVKRLIG